jgi:hypothetical protein
MPLSGDCPCRIAPAAAMVEDFEKKKTLPKHNFYLAFTQQTNTTKLSYLKANWGPSSHVLFVTSFYPNPYATSQAEFHYILSYHM